MLVFSDLSIQLLINWLGRCATAFDSEHVILTSASRWALDLGVEALLDLYLMGRQLSGLLGLGREQSFNQKGTWQRQLGESKPHGARGKSTLAASPGKRPPAPRVLPCQRAGRGAQPAACAAERVWLRGRPAEALPKARSWGLCPCRCALLCSRPQHCVRCWIEQPNQAIVRLPGWLRANKFWGRMGVGWAEGREMSGVGGLWGVEGRQKDQKTGHSVYKPSVPLQIIWNENITLIPHPTPMNFFR